MMTISPLTRVSQAQRAPRFSSSRGTTHYPEDQPSLLERLESINGTPPGESNIDIKLLETTHFQVGNEPITGRAFLSLINQLAINQTRAYDASRTWYDRLRETLIPSSRPNKSEVNINKLYKLLHKGATETDVNAMVKNLKERGFLQEMSQWEPKNGRENVHVRYLALTHQGWMAANSPSVFESA